MADLSGFPIIRIDQIPLVDSDTLASAKKEIKSLISSLLAESPDGVPPMVHYLRKQSEAMSSELMNRLAQDRINALLSGATALLNEDRNRYGLADDDDDEQSTSSMSAITEKSAASPAKPAASSYFQPLPLPSEVRGRGETKPVSFAEKAMPIDSSKYNQVSQASAPTFKRSESSPLGIAMSSRSTDGKEGAAMEYSTNAPDSTISEQSSQQRAPKRPISGDNRPSRRSQQLINEKFGSMFIVAGGERKRRPLPVKKVIESVDEKNSRERLERRKAAMQRLIARKEERQQHIQAQRAKKKAAQREAELLQTKQSTENNASTSSPKQRTGRGNINNNGSQNLTRLPLPADKAGKGEKTDVSGEYASDSESVSGGDDDMDVQEIDQQMIDTVAQAQRAERLDEQLHALDGMNGASSADGNEAADTTNGTENVTINAAQESSEAHASYSADINEPADQHGERAPPSPAIINQPVPAKVKIKRIRLENASESRDNARSTGTQHNRTASSALPPKPQVASDRMQHVESASKPKNRRASPYRENQPPSPSKTRPSPASVNIAGNAQQQHAVQRTGPNLHAVDAAGVMSDDQLASEFEEKNNAALNVLRSMKLKREQMKQGSAKQAVERPASAASNITSSSLVIIESGADAQEYSNDGAQSSEQTHNFAIVLHSSAVHGVDALDTSLDEGSLYPVEDTGVLSITNYEHTPHEAAQPQQQGHFVKVSTLKIDDTITEADVVVQRPNTVPINSPERRKLLDSAARQHEVIQQGHSDGRDNDDGSESPRLQLRRRNTALTFPTNMLVQASTDSVPDLSQTTLEVSDNTSSGALDSSRSVASPSHPLVTKLLMHKNSELLYVKDGFYCSRVGADELPGLRAWKLVSIVDECANWVVNIAKYTAIKPTKMDILDTTPIYQRRASVRKSVSLGLLMLLLDTEDILLGTLRLFSAEHFTTLWREYIRLFDEKAETITMQHGSAVLFREVAVCGNCHAVCKKLENLLKTLFVPTNAVEARLHRTLHAQDDVLASPQSRQSPAHSPLRQSPRPFSSTSNSGQHDGNKISLQNDGLYQDDVHEDAEYPPGPRSLQSLEFSENNTDDDVGDDSGDDDASILPMYNMHQLSAEDSVGIAGADSGSPREATVQASKQHHVTRMDDDSRDTTTVAQGLSSTAMPPKPVECKTPSRKGSNAAGVKLTTFYPNIGSIFPAAYGALGGKQAEDGSEAARMLIESMQVQCKIYEEWMEVMSDYSTVFSDDRRGVSENYFNAQGSEGDGQDGVDAAGNSTVYKGGSRSLHFRVKSGRSEVNNIVTDVFNNFLKAWEELPAGLGLGLSWNILWTWSKPRIKMSHLLVWQRVNHYPDSKELTRKDLLKKNIQRYTNMGGKGGQHFDIMPLTFLLPHEYTAFVQAFTAAETSKHTEDSNIQNFWIMKPIGMSRGRGISLVKDLSQIAYSQSSVVQRYIERPLCLKGYKFDLRLYVLVTSFKPLEAFIYRDGFARVSTHQYSLNPEDTENKFIHLTNSSIQCQNTEGPSKDSPLQAGEDEEDTGGTKISLQGANGLWKRLAEFGIDIAALWQSISLLVIKSLVVVDDKMVHQPCCFEMFGYDVLIDADLRPWLLEVNASPSLARTNALDVRVKNAMIRDIIGVIDPAPYDRAAVLRILRKRLGNIAKNRFTVGRNDPDLEQDLKDILGDYVPRKYGEVPSNMGNYEMLCPGTKEFTQVMNLKKKIIKS